MAIDIGKYFYRYLGVGSMYIESPCHELSAFENDWLKGCRFGKLGV